MKNRLRNNGLWKTSRNERDMALRLFIIISETCFCPPKLSDWDSAITDGVAWTQISATRAGSSKRDYKSTIHKLDKNSRASIFLL